jgi:hypothetical protein
MSSIFVIVTDVPVHQALQVPLIYYDPMVKQIAAAVADPTLGDIMLSWASKAGPLSLDAEELHRYL